MWNILPEGNPVFTLAIASVATGYLSYYFIAHSEEINRKLAADSSERDSAIRIACFQRMTGVVFLGLLPLLAMLLFAGLQPTHLGLGFSNPGSTAKWTLALSAIVVGINFLNARKPSNLRMYPQIRIGEWTYPVLALSGATWAFYLLAYELLFRGILFVPLVPLIGLTPAIALNASIYALAHLPKGMKESLGAIPFGIVICLVTWSVGNIWAAFLVHVVMALSNEWLSLYFHPEMKLK